MIRYNKQVRAMVKRINGLYALKYPLEINKQLEGYRITRDQESRDVSPRLSGKDIVMWLSGFEKGLYYRYASGE